MLDAIPFRERLAFYMELFSHERTPGVSYARIAYHYGRPGLVDDHVRLTDEDVRPLRLPADWQPAARMGARGSTFFQAEDVVEGEANTSLENNDLWAGGKLMVWSPKGADDQLTFKLAAQKPGKHVIRVTAARTPQSGRVAARLDGKPLPLATEDGTVDLKTDFRTLSRTFSTRPLDLTEGDHRLSLRYLGQEEKETIGIDFIWLQRR